MTRNLNRFLAILLLLVGVPFYVLLIDNHAGEAGPKPLDIGHLRQLAASLPGNAPTAIEGEIVASRYVTGNLIAAGSGLKLQKTVIAAWRLPVAGKGPIHINAGLAERDDAVADMRHYYPKAQASVEHSLTQASLIIATQARPWGSAALIHLLARTHAPAARAALLGKMRLPAAQWPATVPPLPASSRISGHAPQAIAPGVVIIPAPGVTPGAQMVFVRLANGREYLFAGDISPLAANWQQLRVQSRLLTLHFGDENRQEARSWLLAIRHLVQQAPALVVVPSHDFAWINAQRHAANPNHGIRFSFTPDQPAAIPK